MEIPKLNLVVLIQVFVFYSCNANEEQVYDNDVKVLVDHSGNLVNPTYGLRPTSKPISHEPGVPPVVSMPNRPSSGFQRPTTSRPTTSRPTNNNPFTWITSIFGRNSSNQTSELVDQLNRLGLNDSFYENLTQEAYKINGSAELIDNLNYNQLIQSQQLVLMMNNQSSGPLVPIPQEPNKGIFDWLLGIVGIHPNNQTNIVKPTKPTKPPSVKHCDKCKCGVTFKHTRIVGGVETQVNAYPWMTILMYNNRFYCGASVINNKYLLTAAHCVNGFNKDRLKAVFFDHDRSVTYETKTFSRKISAILKHRSYNQGGSYNNDISLLRVDEELPFHGLLKPVCLPTIGKSYTGYTGIATGWGATQEHGQVSQKLREVNVPIISNIECRGTQYGNKITDNMLCAGAKHGGKDSCQGDSGGPLHIVNRTQHTQVGIVSWGEGCAEANYPGVYTRVNRYISWIISNTKDACYCS